MSRVNGRSLLDYKDFDVLESGLAVPKAEPAYRDAIVNGLIPEDIILDSLVLYLPLYLLKGTKFKSVDRYASTCTVTGATWKPNGRDFNSATPDYIEIPSTETQLNFTSEDFSIVARAKLDAISSYHSIFMRGLWNTDGYWFTIDVNGALQFLTFQAGANQLSDTDDSKVTTATWYTFGLSRDGSSGKVFINGVDETTTSGSHTNPKTSSRTAKIGIYDSKVAYPFDGKIYLLAVWGKALSTEEHLHMHNLCEGIE